MIAKIVKLTASELVAKVANALKASFENVIEDLSGASFDQSGVSMPSDKVWQRYATAALAAYTEAVEAERFLIGTNTMEKVFEPAGLTNVHDLQAVLDAVEVALVLAPNTAARSLLDKVFEAEQDFRETMPRDWEGDPLSDAIEALRSTLSSPDGPVEAPPQVRRARGEESAASHSPETAENAIIKVSTQSPRNAGDELVVPEKGTAVAGELGQPDVIPALTGQFPGANVSGPERAGVTAGETAPHFRKTTPMAKLTALQLDTLALFRDGKVEQHNHGHGAWRIHGASPSVVGRLVSLGLARWTKVIGGDAELTDAGRAALPSSGASEHGLGDRPEYQRVASDAENHSYDFPEAVGGCEINVVHGVLHPETEERTTAQKSSPVAKGASE